MSGGDPVHGLVELALVKCAHVAVQRPFQNVDRAGNVAVIGHQRAPVKMDMQQFVSEVSTGSRPDAAVRKTIDEFEHGAESGARRP